MTSKCSGNCPVGIFIWLGLGAALAKVFAAKRTDAKVRNQIPQPQVETEFEERVPQQQEPGKIELLSKYLEIAPDDIHGVMKRNSEVLDSFDKEDSPPNNLQTEASQAAKSEEAQVQGGKGPNDFKWHCSICWESSANQTVFPGCGHVIICENCTKSHDFHKCLVCKKRSKPRKLYFM